MGARVIAANWSSKREQSAVNRGYGGGCWPQAVRRRTRWWKERRWVLSMRWKAQKTSSFRVCPALSATVTSIISPASSSVSPVAFSAASAPSP
eukprot:3915630-Rhodomonas_salina.1